MNLTYDIQHFDKEWDKLTIAFQDQLLNLDQEHFDRPWPRDSWEQLLSGSGREFQVSTLLVDQKIMGFVLFLVEKIDHRAHLVKILCHPEIRGRGLGHKLLSLSQQRLTDLYATSLFDLEVETNNHAALGLYQKLGYKKIRKLKDLYGTSLHGVAMQFKLR
jgi:ribosomal protein S18 acetylase RimI-like enzyme